jgi:hypothetical protein
MLLSAKAGSGAVGGSLLSQVTLDAQTLAWRRG